LVKLTCLQPDGTDITLDLRAPGQFVDTFSHHSNGTYRAAATALTHISFYRLRVVDLESVLAKELDTARLWRKEQSAELRRSLSVLADRRTFTARQRFEKLLWTIFHLTPSHDNSKGRGLPAALTETEIAALTSVSLCHASRIKRDLEKKGVLQRHGNRIVVCKAEALFHQSML